MSCCDGSDNMVNEDVEVKQEPFKSDTVKLEEFTSEFESKDPHCDLPVAAQLQPIIQPGKL